MVNWPRKRLGDALELIIDHRGKTPKKLGSDWSQSGHRVISAINIKNSRVNDNDHHYVDEETYQKWMKTPLQADDVILTSEAPLGEAAYINKICDWVLGQRLFGLRPMPGVMNGAFLYYYLQSPQAQADLLSRSSGTTVFGIKQAELVKVPVAVPPLVEQQAIAQILQALDAKQEANHRLADTVDDLSRHIFLETLRDHHTDSSTYSSLNIFGGGTPSTKNSGFWGGSTHWATPSDITALQHPYLFDTDRLITTSGLDACNSPLLPEGSVLMTSRATIGAFAINQVPTAVNQGFIAVVPETPQERWWILYHMQNDVEMMKQLANGATFLELSRKIFRQMPYSRPSDAILRGFHDAVDPLHKTAISAQKENQLLKALRDTLLPKLMNGTLAVRTAEELVDTVA